MTLAVGFFDGVHRGHQAILAEADAALTFLQHPAVVFAPERAPALLMTVAERLAAIGRHLRGSPGVRAVHARPFTAETAHASPEEFVRSLHNDFPFLTAVYCGPNWTFGAGGAGTPETLAALGIATRVIPFACDGTGPVSSTRIRKALAAGDVTEATRLLGHPFDVAGQIFPGKGLGRQLGFPTLNVVPDNPDLKILLPRGVYAVDAPWGRGLANWGQAPTLGNAAWREPVLEVHFLSGARLPTGGTGMTVTLERFLRPEKKFPTLEALRTQLEADVAQMTVSRHSTGREP